MWDKYLIAPDVIGYRYSQLSEDCIKQLVNTINFLCHCQCVYLSCKWFKMTEKSISMMILYCKISPICLLSKDDLLHHFKAKTYHFCHSPLQRSLYSKHFKTKHLCKCRYVTVLLCWAPTFDIKLIWVS